MSDTELTEMDIFEIFNDLSEPGLMHIDEPSPGLFIAETPMIIERALSAGYRPEVVLAEEGMENEVERLFGGFIRDQAITEQTRPIDTNRKPQVQIEFRSADELDRITGYRLTRGILCAMRRTKGITASEAVRGARRIAVLENVMNPTNLGAIMRSAAALGMEAVLLTRGCADPLYRRALRVGMGTAFAVPWAYVDTDENGLVEALHGLGFKTVAMALRNNTIDIDDPALKQEERLAIILGTEGEGLCEATIDASDYTVKIPMYHGVDSLNVAAASAVAFWELKM